MRLSSTGRNDTDDFFALFLIESMDDQQNRTGAYGSNGYPPLLIFRSEVALGKSIGIIENEHDRFKANIVLAKVLPVFLFIPLKSQNLAATTTAYGLFLHVSIHLYVHRPAIRAGASKQLRLSPPWKRAFTSKLDSVTLVHADVFGRAPSQTSKVPERSVLSSSFETLKQCGS